MGSFTMPADLAEIINTHRALFGGFTMQADDLPPEPDQPPATPPATPEPPATGDEDEALGEPGKKALVAERKAARETRQQLADAQAKLQAIEDQGKTELQKATDAAAKAQQDADQARQELTRERVARRHGLSDEDTELLTGDEEQMERLAARITQAPPPGAGAPPKSGPVPGIGKVPETRNITLTDQITAAEQAGDKALVSTLKAMQLAAAAN